MSTQRAETFENENGNAILIEVGGTDQPCDVRISITGPHSEQESILTRIEAERLYVLLGRHLHGLARGNSQFFRFKDRATPEQIARDAEYQQLLLNCMTPCGTCGSAANVPCEHVRYWKWEAK